MESERPAKDDLREAEVRIGGGRVVDALGKLKSPNGERVGVAHEVGIVLESEEGWSWEGSADKRAEGFGCGLRPFGPTVEERRGGRRSKVAGGACCVRVTRGRQERTEVQSGWRTSVGGNE